MDFQRSLFEPKASETHPQDMVSDESYKTHVFGYTINVAPFKTILGSKWSAKSPVTQQAILDDFITNALWHIGRTNEEDTHTFEFTEKGNCHAHGMIRADYVQMHNFQAYIKNGLGYPNTDPERICKVIKTDHDPKHWLAYMNKYQNLPDSPQHPPIDQFLF